MSEIPEDIQRLVGALLGPCDERMNRAAYNALSLGIARAILAERLAQQERCARIAETDTDWTPFQRNSKREALFAYTTGIAAGRAIAAAIRKPTPYPAWQKLSD